MDWQSVSRSEQRTPPYDGRADWDAYRTVLRNLPSDNLYNYSSLVIDALFGCSFWELASSWTAQDEVEEPLLEREEGLAELADDIERLARLVYPTVPSTMLKLLAKDQFIDACRTGACGCVWGRHIPRIYGEVLQSALELVVFQLASQHRTKLMIGAILEDDEQEANNPSRMALSHEDLTESMQ